MSTPDAPQLYLISPPDIDTDSFPDSLAVLLDHVPVACFRLALQSLDEDHIARAADLCRDVCHARDVPLIVKDMSALVERLGLDGVHLAEQARDVRAARKVLGPDAIVGAFAHGSRHDGMNAAEAGADYVSFGPVGGAMAAAEHALFEWWTEMIEVPIVAEGGLSLETVETLAPVTDFVGLGEEIWRAEDPAATLAAFAERLG